MYLIPACLTSHSTSVQMVYAETHLRGNSLLSPTLVAMSRQYKKKKKISEMSGL